MPKEIQVANQQSKMRIKSGILTQLAAYTLRHEKSKRKGVSILICSDTQIKKYHYQYFGDRSSTDVISLAMNEKDLAPTEKDHLGDLIISAETAKRVSASYGQKPHQELERYLVHGLLHLLGYDDISPKDYSRMYAMQEKILTQFHKQQKKARS